jgi:hypothetical protein
MKEDKRNAYRLLMGKSGVKRPLGRLGRWILEKLDGWCGLDWSGSR